MSKRAGTVGGGGEHEEVGHRLADPGPGVDADGAGFGKAGRYASDQGDRLSLAFPVAAHDGMGLAHEAREGVEVVEQAPRPEVGGAAHPVDFDAVEVIALQSLVDEPEEAVAHLLLLVVPLPAEVPAVGAAGPGRGGGADQQVGVATSCGGCALCHSRPSSEVWASFMRIEAIAAMPCRRQPPM